MSSPDEVKSSSAPAVVSSSIAFARACICSVLSFARWTARPTSAMCSPMPGRRLADPHLRLGRRVLRLDHFLLRAERLDLRLQRALALDQLLLLSLELLALLHDPVELRLDGGLARQRLAGEILAAGLQRLPRLAVELLDLLLHRRCTAARAASSRSSRRRCPRLTFWSCRSCSS